MAPAVGNNRDVVDPRQEGDEFVLQARVRKEVAAERIGFAVVLVFAAALVLAFVLPLLSYWFVAAGKPVSAESSVAELLKNLTAATVENVKSVAAIFSSLLTLVLSYYFFQGSGRE